MKVNMSKELKKNSLLGHIIISGMTKTLGHTEVGQLANECTTDEGVVLDVVLTVNGKEVDLAHFVEHWQSQVGSLLTAEVARVIDEKFSDIEDLLCDLKARIEPEIDKRMEKWEKQY